MDHTKTKNKRKPKSANKYYVDPEVFKPAILEYYKTGVCTDYLGECLNKIAEGLSFYPSFINYSYKDEMVGDAIAKMWAALKNKKYKCSEETNPFSYFTTIAIHAFINRIKKEQKHHNTLTEYKARKYEELLTTGEINVYIKPSVDLEDDSNYYYEDNEDQS